MSSLSRNLTAFGIALAVTTLLLGVLTVSAEKEGSEASEQPSVVTVQEVYPEEERGGAGLLGSTGTSVAFALALGTFSAAMFAGGRSARKHS